MIKNLFKEKSKLLCLFKKEKTTLEHRSKV